MDLMKKLLNPNKDARITAAEALKHPFLTTGINFSNLLKGIYAENSKLLKKIYHNKYFILKNFFSKYSI